MVDDPMDSQMRLSSKIWVVVSTVALVFAGATGSALAFDESTGEIPDFSEENCATCHDPWPTFGGYGVHGGFTSTTSKCEECHSVHDAFDGGVMLLPAATIEATCFTCHDGTQGRGVYGAIKARTGIEPTSGHRVEVTSLVPGGDASTGGSVTMTLGGASDSLTCTDCHSPHGSDIVNAFQGDRIRTSWMPTPLASYKILKQQPGDTTGTPVTEYGSDWCLACHAGRSSDLTTVHNHPVDSGAGAFTYSNVVRLASDSPTSTTTTGTLGRSHRGYLMPWDSTNATRTPLQQGHAPICQQCHEDARNVGTLSTAGDIGDAATYSASVDGTPTTGNPQFQNFPHESTNARLLVESEDNLCLNCHPTGQLP